MTKVKLCGLTRIEDIECVNILKPEYIGFVFWDKSFRNISESQAYELKSLLDKDIKSVGVFVDPDMDYVYHLYKRGIIDIAQLHGNESNEDILYLKRLGVPVIRAFILSTEEDNSAVLDEALNNPADFLLFDTGKGSGMAFNWEMLKDFPRPFFMAGGLNPENVSQAIKTANPFAVDVSSGIETTKIKDSNKMKQFVMNARQ